MNYKRIFWGVLLVTLGVALVLKNLGVIFFSWHAIWHLWPVLLILWGISVLPVKDAWKLLLSLLAIVITVFVFYKAPEKYRDSWSFSFDDGEEYTYDTGLQDISEPFDSSTCYAVIRLDAAAGTFILRDTTAQLISFNNQGKIGTYSMEVQQEGDTSIIDLDLHPFKKKGKHSFSTSSHRVNLSLNTLPVWSFNLDAGAASIDMDLSPFKVDRISLDGGASSVSIKLGKASELSYLDIDAGASSVKVEIPQDAGCQVISNTVLSSKHLKGFDKVAKHTYQTPGFQTSTRKIFIELDAAVSSLDVNRY